MLYGPYIKPLKSWDDIWDISSTSTATIIALCEVPKSALAYVYSVYTVHCICNWVQLLKCLSQSIPTNLVMGYKYYDVLSITLFILCIDKRWHRHTIISPEAEDTSLASVLITFFCNISIVRYFTKPSCITITEDRIHLTEKWKIYILQLRGGVEMWSLNVILIISDSDNVSAANNLDRYVVIQQTSQF